MSVIRIAQLVLRDHFPGSRLAVVISFLLLGAALLRWVFYSAPGAELGAGVIGIIGAIIITYRFTDWANSSLGYAFVFRRRGRLMYLLAIYLASWLAASLLYGAVRLITSAGGNGSLLDSTAGSLVLMGCLSLVVVVVLLLSPLVMGTEWFRTIFLAMVAFSIYREQAGEMDARLRWPLDAFWTAFASPVVGALHLSVTWETELSLSWLAGITTIEVALLLITSLILFTHRNLSW